MLRVRAPGGVVHDIDQGPQLAVPRPGYSLRGHAIVPLTAYAKQRQCAAAYVEANRDAVNARKRGEA